MKELKVLDADFEEEIPKSIQDSYTPDLADRICELLGEGKALRNICGKDGIPVTRTIYKWMRVYPPFSRQYQIAKEEAADAMVEEMLEIADDARNDWMERNGDTVPDHEHIQRSRVRIDTRKWIAAKLKPRRYADKIDHTVSGSEGGPINLGCVVKFVHASAPLLTHNTDGSDSAATG